MRNDKIKNYSKAEIADGFVLPEKLSKKQEAEAAKQLSAARAVSHSKMTDSQKMAANLLQLRFKLENYLASKEFVAGKTFGYFLMSYLDVINRKRSQFASEIDIHETLLSQLIHNRRIPGESIIIRLELHSNSTIPASYWYRLVEKEKEHHIRNDKKLRVREKKFVKNRISFSL